MNKYIKLIISIFLGIYIGKYLSDQCLDEPCLVNL